MIPNDLYAWAINCAISNFDPNLLCANHDGVTLLAHRDDEHAWETTGFVEGEGWHVSRPSRPDQIWTGGVYDPYFVKKLIHGVLDYRGVPVHEGEDVKAIMSIIEPLINDWRSSHD